MSRRVFAVFALMALATAPVAGAQDRAALQQRLQRLRAAYRMDSVALEEERRAQAALARFDSIPAGPLKLASSPSISNVVREGAAAALPRIERTFGAALDSFPAKRIVLTSTGARGVRSDEIGIIVSATTRADEFEGMIAYAVSGAFATEDSIFRRWSSNVVSTDPDRKTVNQAAYAELVTAESQAARDCFQDSLRACGQVLGIIPVEDAVSELFSAEDRWSMVRTRWQLNSGRVETYARCVRGRSDEACTELLQLPYHFDWNVLGSQSRVSLLYVALDRGGDGAFARWWRGRDRPIADRLVDASGMTVDSLLSTWRTEIIAAGGTSVALPVRTALVAIGWCLVMAFAALRSSRWR